MPIKPCSKNGKEGYKWGDSGTCYTGKNGRAQAGRQAAAAYANGYRGETKSEEVELLRLYMLHEFMSDEKD
jgi:hypothetical protein